MLYKYINKTGNINFFLSPSNIYTEMHLINYPCNIHYILFTVTRSQFFTIFLLFYRPWQNYTNHEPFNIYIYIIFIKKSAQHKER